MIGIEKIITGATGTPSADIIPPAGKEYVIRTALIKHGAALANCSYSLVYGSTVIQSNTTSVATSIWFPLETAFPSFAKEPLIITPTFYLRGTTGVENITGFYVLVLERPLYYELQALEHQYKPDGNLMPPGLSKMIDAAVGYRSRMAKL